MPTPRRSAAPSFFPLSSGHRSAVSLGLTTLGAAALCIACGGGSSADGGESGQTASSDSTDASAKSPGTSSTTDGGSSSGDDTGSATSEACDAVADAKVTSSVGTSVALSWAGAPGTTIAISRKSYCGSDDYDLLTKLPAGASSYTDTTVQADWAYWYEITATDASAHSASSVVGVWASNTEGPGCSAGATPQPSGVSTSACTSPPSVDGGASADGGSSAPDSGTTSDAGPAPVGIPAGATVVSPGDDIASAVEACAGGAVYFNAGTYPLTSSINVPSSCTLMGAPKWSSVITGGTGENRPIFQLNSSSNVTITELNFQNLNSMVIGNYNGQGTPKDTHIDFNLFEHFADEAIPIFIFDATDLLIERNAFNDLHEDSIHLLSHFTNGLPTNPSKNVVVRWNFGANQSYGSGETGAFIEIQLGTAGLDVYQNVYYSENPGHYDGMALSIASGGIPCSGQSNGQFTGCLPLDDGQHGVTIDGNIILDNNVPAGVTDNMGAIEIMGVMPLVQNNYIRHWAGLGMYTWIFGSSGGVYSGNGGVVTIADNTGCDAYGASTFSSFSNEGDGNGPFDKSPITVDYSGNTYATSCASIPAPPALYPQIVAPPDLLDDKGGMWAVSNSSVAGPNTYWPTINAAAGL